MIVKSLIFVLRRGVVLRNRWLFDRDDSIVRQGREAHDPLVLLYTVKVPVTDALNGIVADPL